MQKSHDSFEALNPIMERSIEETIKKSIRKNLELPTVSKLDFDQVFDEEIQNHSERDDSLV